MIVIFYGIYRFSQRIVGCRNDFCNACKTEVLTERWRAFNVGHLFWIPLLPLGWHERWCCTKCGRDPRARYTTGRGYYIAGIIAFALIATLMWFMPPVGEDAGTIWGMRLLFSAAALAMVYGLQKSRGSDLLHQEKRRAVTPLSQDHCPYCNGLLVQRPEAECPICHVRIYVD